jgi:4-amino-4-deoxy-L-arabinose transferase-like glycosyltransferase
MKSMPGRRGAALFCSTRILDLLPFAFGIVLCIAAPLRTAFRFGRDEGYELMKAYLVTLGHPLYKEIWNDQPPLHTEMVAFLFRCFGRSAFVARLLSIIFAAVLVGALYKCISLSASRTAGLIGVVLMVSFSFVLRLSVSVMLELPAIALAMASIYAWRIYSAKKLHWWMALSGCLFGLALQIKLTAGMFLPALIIEFCITYFNKRRSARAEGKRILYCILRDAGIWLSAALIVFCVVACSFYQGNTAGTFWRSHVFRGGGDAAAEFPFKLGKLFFSNVPQCLAALCGLVVFMLKRRQDLLAPSALLTTALTIHTVHRPYWYYYALHFAVPVAWLGAFGIIELCALSRREPDAPSLAMTVIQGARRLASYGLVSILLAFSAAAVWREGVAICAEQPASENPVVLSLEQRAKSTHWVFTDCDTCAFWAGLPVPPELAVVPLKRIWACEVTKAQITECLDRYRPEQIVFVSDWERRFGLGKYLQEHYTRDAVTGIYVRK